MPGFVCIVILATFDVMSQNEEHAAEAEKGLGLYC